MNCLHCGSVNPSDNKFCGDCGAALDNRCPQCHADNPADKKFCGDCGASLTRTPPQRPADAGAASAAADRRTREPSSYTPKHLADKILQAKSLGENIADCELYLSAAEAAVATGRLVDARRDLLKGDQTCSRRKEPPDQLHFVWAQYHDGRAQETQDGRQRARFLTQARERYDRFAANARGFRADRARERSQELADELAGAAAPGE